MGKGVKAGISRLGLLALIGALAALTFGPALAQAKSLHLFVEDFGSAQKLSFTFAGPLAVDQSTGDLLVMDLKAQTLSRWHSDGTPSNFTALGTNVIDAAGKGNGPGKTDVHPCAAPIPDECDETPQGSFAFDTTAQRRQVAVDSSCYLHNPPLSGAACESFDPANGNIYVSQENTHVVDVFAASGEYLGQLKEAGGVPLSGLFNPCGVAVGSTGEIFVGGGGAGKVYRFSPSSNPPPANGAVLTAATGGIPCNLAVGTGPSTGSLFVDRGFDSFITNTNPNVSKVSIADGTLQSAFPFHAGANIAVSPATGHLFLAVSFLQPQGLFEYDASGSTPIEYQTYQTVPVSAGVAIAGQEAEDELIYSSKSGTGAAKTVVQVFGPSVKVPDVASGDVEITSDTSVRLKGTVDPDGAPIEDCHFEWGPTSEYGNVAACEPNAGEIGSGSEPIEVHADIGGLAKESGYHFRLVAYNHNAVLFPQDALSKSKGEDRKFSTPSKPVIKEVWSQDVATKEAGLRSRVSPGNSATTYHFEWGVSTSYGNSGPEISLGSDDSDRTVGLVLSGLEPATTYHYRLVASNGIGVSESGDRTFLTFAVPVASSCPENEALRRDAALLPDCRAYEMVSPLDKEGGDIIVSGGITDHDPAVLVKAAISGSRLAYGSLRAFGDAPSAPFTSQYIAERAPDGWVSHAITPPREKSVTGNVFVDLDREFRAFSDDLCQGWLIPSAEPILAEGATPGYLNLYRREDRLCGPEHYTTISDALPEDNLGAYRLELQGTSADGEVTAFVANDNLTGSGAPPQSLTCSPQSFYFCDERLYLKAADDPPLFACILPSGAPLQGSCSAGSGGQAGFPRMRRSSVIGALSSDASRLYWTAEREDGRIYLRENPLQPQSPLAHGYASGTGKLTEGQSAITSLVAARGKASTVSGSSIATLVEDPSVGRFVPGQPVAGTGVPPGTTVVKVEGKALVLSASATATNSSVTLTSTGPMPFEVGQAISAPGIPPETTIVALKAGELKISKAATVTASAVPLSAMSECTEAAKACTIEVSKAGEEEAKSSSSHFWAAAKDGSSALYTSGSFSGNGNNLYRFTREGEATAKLAGKVRGVMGASDDTSRVYFVATEAIAGAGQNSEGDEAVAGEQNLYLWEAGAGYRFVAILAGGSGDLNAADAHAVAREPYSRTSRVSPDGISAAFVSVAPITGYDNTDVSSPAACGAEKGICDAEVFLYDAAARGGEGETLCVSCNPSGARPAGAELGTGAIQPFPLAARLPTFENTLYAPRALAEDGSRLFFESQDPLVLRDTNGRLDVYQWERVESGGCEQADTTFSPAAGGCVELISSGQSPRDSTFLDASPSGDDVFFTTLSSLLPQDYGLVDVYDARVDGGFPPAAPPSVACEGEACQGAHAPPDDPTPASESFQGAGNVREEPPAPPRKPCAKGKVRRHGKCIAKRTKKAHRRAKRNGRSGR